MTTPATWDEACAGAAMVVRRCLETGVSIAACESLTGGLVAAALTSVPGASQVFRGGLVTYAADLKTALAKVPAPVVARGVVTRETARAMAAGVRCVAQADFGVATTGVAGPGPADGVTPGTAWVAVAGPAGGCERLLHCPGEREAVRLAVVVEVLADLAAALRPPR